MSDNPGWALDYVPTPAEWNSWWSRKVSWDDPNNTSGLGAPAILRGTVSTYNLSGLTTGTGLSTAVRTANATALQNAITYAASNGKYFELASGTYEIYSSTGLTIPYTAKNFVWRGAFDAFINQFYTNAPALVIGDGAGVNITSGYDIEGVNVSYGASQSGQTSASALVLGPLWLSRIRQVSADASGGFSPYIGINVVGSGSFFSNRISDVYVSGCQRNFLNISNQSTQNVWERLHLTGGGFTPVAISGPALQIDSGGAAGNGSTFIGLNIEHCLITGGTALVRLDGARGMNMHNVHFEDNAGAFAIFQLIDAGLNIFGMDVLDHRVLAADGLGSGANVFNMYYNLGRVTATGVLMQWTGGGKVDSPFPVFGGQSDGNGPFMATMRGFELKDFGGNNLDSHMTIDANMGSDYQMPRSIDTYRSGPLYSFIEGAQTVLSDADFTHYGQSRHAYLQFPAALAANRTLTLSNNMRSTSPGATVARLVGDSVYVYRGQGTATNNLLVKDGAGTTLTTNTTSATGYTYVYNGTNFVAVT